MGETIKLDRIFNEIVEKIKAENKPCKYFYKSFIQKIRQIFRINDLLKYYCKNIARKLMFKLKVISF